MGHFNKIEDLIIDALLTDGGHHKQWYLEQILKEHSGEKVAKQAKRECQWEEGIA